MKKFTNFVLVTFLFWACAPNKNAANIDTDRKALAQTSINIRAAFAKGDVQAIVSYHHPDVVKALGYKNFLNGRNAVEADLKNTLQNFTLHFTENKLESLLIDGNTATEMTLFAIEGTPKDGSKPFTFKGRAMIVYVRYKESPTGWASIRELIQPATE